MPWVDMDQLLVDRFGPIADQFLKDGEGQFRARESMLVAELCDDTDRIVSTGGGVWANDENRRLLAAHYRTVVLHAPIETLQRRVNSDGRPLWDDQVAARYLNRERAYAQAELVVDVARKSAVDVVDLIVAWLDE